MCRHAQTQLTKTTLISLTLAGMGDHHGSLGASSLVQWAWEAES